MIAPLRRHLAAPLLLRDARVRMRRRRTALLVAGCLAIVLSAGLAAYATSPGAAGDPDVVALAATALFRGAGVATLVLVAVLAAALGAGAITGERERGTLEGLRATPLPAWRLAAAKLLDAVLVAGLVALAPLPLDGLALYLGGVDVATAGGFLAVCLGAALVSSALGLLCSTLAPSTAAATAAAVAALLLLSALPLALGVTVTTGTPRAATCSAPLCPAPSPPTAKLAGASVTPLTASLPLLTRPASGSTEGAGWWHIALPLQAGVTVVLVAASSLVLRSRRWLL